ncbi:MAG TPA: thermonuclease family protein [Bauldia sp.]|nr:thermonuclease family protein [Bauldia sp.]
MRRGRLNLAVVAMAGAIAAPPSFSAGDAAECPSAGTAPLSVASAVDGATLRLADGSEVRLAGVEAPMRPLDLPAGAPWPIADEARERLAALVGGGDTSAAWVAAGPDRYGRRHAYVFAGGVPVAQALLEEGLARAREYPDESACFGPFLAAEAPALVAGRGLWALSQFRPVSADDSSLAEKNGLYALVEGRIDSVGHGTRMTFLDFGRDFRRDFTVMVPQELAVELAGAGLDPASLTGKRVRVRGVLEQSGGPAIVLDDAAALVVIDKANDTGAGK